jgi:LytS/YehU family sensor histidine kinase
MPALRLPPLAVQTLIENGIDTRWRHIGWDRRFGCWRARPEDGCRLTFPTPAWVYAGVRTGGHSLDNCANRLAMLFGDTADLRVTRQDGWTTVRLMFPVVAPTSAQA